MNKTTVLLLYVFISVGMFAQDTLYVYRGNLLVSKYATTNLDSLSFKPTVGTTQQLYIKEVSGIHRAFGISTIISISFPENALSINQTAGSTPILINRNLIRFLSFKQFGDLNTAIQNDIFNPVTFSVFPNPVKDMIYLNSYPNRIKELTIFSADGKIQYNSNIIDSDNLQISVSFLENGVYWISAKVNNKLTTQKFIKN